MGIFWKRKLTAPKAV